MKNFFPLKFLVIVYSLYFLIPLFFILYLPNQNFGFIVLKIFLILWMVYIFFQASKRYPQITLGAFLCIISLYFTLWWFLSKHTLGFVFSLLFIFWYFFKFKQIDKLHELHLQDKQELIKL